MVDEQYRKEQSLSPYQEFMQEHIKKGHSMAEAAKLQRDIRNREDPAESEELLDAIETTFVLERDLQGALRSNIEQLEPGLKIIDGGKEITTDAGRIDIKAEDEQGSIVIIELKAGVASPSSVAQILAYMGSVSKKEEKPIRGILVAGDFHPRVVFAARAVPNLQLMKYGFQFSFNPVN